MRRTMLVGLGLMLLWFCFLSNACHPTQTPQFALYLADTGELAISEVDIQSYESATHTIKLNDSGIARVNSLDTPAGRVYPPSGIFAHDFVMKIRGQEVCRGHFNSALSSMLFTGVTIVGLGLPMSDEYNQLWITAEYPDGYAGNTYPYLYAQLNDIFRQLELLH